MTWRFHFPLRKYDFKHLFYFQLTHLLTWSPVPPVVALSFFSRQFPPHPITAQFAVRVVSSYPPVTIRILDPALRQLEAFQSKIIQKSELTVSGWVVPSLTRNKK